MPFQKSPEMSGCPCAMSVYSQVPDWLWHAAPGDSELLDVRQHFRSFSSKSIVLLIIIMPNNNAHYFTERISKIIAQVIHREYKY